MKVSELLEQVNELHPCAHSTIMGRRCACKPIQDQEVTSITKLTARKYFNQNINHQYSDNSEVKLTLNSGRTYIRHLKAIWNYGNNSGLFKEVLGHEVENPWKLLSLARDFKSIAKMKKYPKREYSDYSLYHHDPLFLTLWYTGARIREITGLQKEDIVTNGAIWYFNIRPTKRRPLKTLNSARKVPIHSALYDVLDDLKINAQLQRVRHHWSTQFRINCNLEPREAAHSLRHSFHTRARRANINEAMIRELTGHAHPVIGDYYGDFDLETKKKAIEQLPIDK